MKLLDTTSAATMEQGLVTDRFILLIKAEESFCSQLHINRQFCAVHHTQKNKAWQQSRASEIWLPKQYLKWISVNDKEGV